MKIALHLYFLSILSLLISSCSAPCIEGEGETIKEKRALLAYDELELNISAELEILYSPANTMSSIVIDAQENLMPFIITRVDGNKLIIESDQCLNSLETISLILPVKRLSSITNTGSGRIFGTSKIPFEALDILNEGSGNIDVSFKGKELNIENQGSGQIVMSGGADELNVRCLGSGSVLLTEMMAVDVDINCKGSGDVKVWSTQSVDVILSGSGSVGYKGNPRDVSEENTGSGTIFKLDAK